MILSRVVLGRCEEFCDERPARGGQWVFVDPEMGARPHSFKRDWRYTVRKFQQVYPEYIVKLNSIASPRRIARARRPRTQFFAHNPALTASITTPPKDKRMDADSTGLGVLKTDENDRLLSPAKVKMCVVCMSKAADRVLVPCGHVCLCEDCSSFQELARLRNKCPECRQIFREVIKIYSQVVEADK